MTFESLVHKPGIGETDTVISKLGRDKDFQKLEGRQVGLGVLIPFHTSGIRRVAPGGTFRRLSGKHWVERPTTVHTDSGASMCTMTKISRGDLGEAGSSQGDLCIRIHKINILFGFSALKGWGRGFLCPLPPPAVPAFIYLIIYLTVFVADTQPPSARSECEQVLA